MYFVSFYCISLRVQFECFCVQWMLNIIEGFDKEFKFCSYRIEILILSFDMVQLEFGIRLCFLLNFLWEGQEFYDT